MTIHNIIVTNNGIHQYILRFLLNRRVIELKMPMIIKNKKVKNKNIMK